MDVALVKLITSPPISMATGKGVGYNAVGIQAADVETTSLSVLKVTRCRNIPLLMVIEYPRHNRSMAWYWWIRVALGTDMRSPWVMPRMAACWAADAFSGAARSAVTSGHRRALLVAMATSS